MPGSRIGWGLVFPSGERSWFNKSMNSFKICLKQKKTFNVTINFSHLVLSFSLIPVLKICDTWTFIVVDVMSRWGQILTLWLRSCFCGPFGLLDHYCIALCCTQRIGELETRSHTGIRNLWQVERLHLKQNRQFKIHHYLYIYFISHLTVKSICCKS